MKRCGWGGMTCVALMILWTASAFAEGAAVKITKAEGKDQYDISIGGKLFTSYLYSDKDFHDKPIFFPVLSPKGTPVNRSYPVGPTVKGESTDHPHHQSMWFTYGDVSGIDYWNLQKNGRHIQNREVKADGNKLMMTLDWIDPKGVKVLEEKRVVTFGGSDGLRWMDHDITLKANEADVVFGDSKEGAFGMRLARTLEEKGYTGHYINAEGLETSAKLWGKQSDWVALTGSVKGKSGDEDVTVAIFSRPDSFNHPPRWHARDYGLFTVNPWGRKGYDEKAKPMATPLKKGETQHLVYRIAIYDGKMDKARLAADYAGFSKTK